MTRLRRTVDHAVDYLWPIVATVSALLPERLVRWVREAPEPEVVA